VLAARVNELLRNVLPERPDPRAEGGFILTPFGIMLAWDVYLTDEEWRDEYTSGEGMEHMSEQSDGRLSEAFDLPMR